MISLITKLNTSISYCFSSIAGKFRVCFEKFSSKKFYQLDICRCTTERKLMKNFLVFITDCEFRRSRRNGREKRERVWTSCELKIGKFQPSASVISLNNVIDKWWCCSRMHEKCLICWIWSEMRNFCSFYLYTNSNWIDIACDIHSFSQQQHDETKLLRCCAMFSMLDAARAHSLSHSHEISSTLISDNFSYNIAGGAKSDKWQVLFHQQKMPVIWRRLQWAVHDSPTHEIPLTASSRLKF